MDEKLNILSLFDGASTLQLALKNVGIPVNNYYASEIKPYAIKLSNYHFPNTIHLGDIRNWQNWKIDWKSIDLVGSGSPCQDLSIAGKRKGITGERSSLFFVFVEIFNHIRKYNPDVKFLQENVASAPGKDVKIMSDALEIYPQTIDSKLFVPQSRKRLYWSNIKTCEIGLFRDLFTCFDIPGKRKSIFAIDIIENGRAVKPIFPTLTERYTDSNWYADKNKLRKRLLTKSVPYVIQLNESKESGGKQPYQQNTIYDVNGILPAICKRNYGKIKIDEEVRTLTKIEMCRLQGFPDDYCDIVSYNQAGSLLGDAWTLPVIEMIIKQYKDILKL